VTTRVIVHPAPEDADDGLWDAWIQEHADPYRLKTLADLNDIIGELGLRDCVYYAAAVPCEGKNEDTPCWLVATGTVLWAGPAEYRITRVCNTHQDTAVEDAIRLGYPHTVIPVPVRASQAYFSHVSYQDMAALTRALVGYDVPDDVFAQQVCSGCDTRICLPVGSLQWAGPDGNLECKAGGPGHIPVVLEITTGEPGVVPEAEETGD
jgi:hypothetical protein